MAMTETDMQAGRRRASTGLVVEDLQLAYGDLTAVWGASLTARPGEVTALLGRNGAGKTTLLSGIAGLVKTVAGTVHVDGRDLTRQRPWVRNGAGIGLVLEGRRVFRDLTVRENLQVALPRGSARRTTERLEEVLVEFPLLATMLERHASELSGGQQQQLAIAQAVAGEPSVLLVDEPSSGLSPQAYEAVLEVLRAMAARGLAIVLVEQLVEQVLGEIAHQVVVLERGRVVLDLPASQVNRETIADLYMAG